MRIVLNIEKRYVYSVLTVLIIFTAIVAVYALNSGNGNIMGHTPDELLPGTFGNGGNLDLWYTFQNPVYFEKNILVGKVGAGTLQGIITLKGGQYSRGDLDDVIIDNSGGGLRVSNATWSQLFLLSNNGNIITKPGAWIQTSNIALNGNLCIGPDPGDHSNCKIAWPTTSTFDYLPGMHCGMYTSGVIANVNIPCKGMNVYKGSGDRSDINSYQCPTGFTLAGGDYQSPGNRYWWSCVKN